jgi:hypothetical protein
VTTAQSEQSNSVLIKARASVVLRDSIKLAVKRELTTPSEWMRRALSRELGAVGIDPQAMEQAA